MKSFRKQIFYLAVIGLLSLTLLVACDEATTPTPVSIPASPSSLLPPSLPTPSSNQHIGYADTDPVGRVDGVAISADDFNKAVDEARATEEEASGQVLDWNTDENKNLLKELRQQSLEGLINYVVVANQAAKEGVTVSSDAIQSRLDDFKKQLGTADNYKAWLSRRFMSEADYKKRLAQLVIFEAMSDKHSAVNDKEEQVHARHILVQTEQEARDLYARLQQGADFAALAKQFSLDTESAGQGGDLGWLFHGQTDPNFEQTAFALTPNSFSGPVKTDKGYHLIQSLGKEVRSLPVDLVQQRKQEAFANYIKALRDKAKIETLINLN